MAQIQVNISAFNKILNTTARPFLLQKAREIADEARSLAPVGATGDLKNNITVEIGEGNSIVVKVSTEYAGFVHQGTGSQHIPDPRANYYPGIRKSGLIMWSASKGVNPYKIAHGISIAGTKPNPFLSEAIEKVLGKFSFRWISREIKEA